MASVFLKLEGNTVRNRIWDFLIVHSEFDYSMREIAKFSSISYTAMKGIWKDFVSRKLVVHTRNVGKAKMYKLNMKNAEVKKFIDYYWEVITNEAEREHGIKSDKDIFPHYSSRGLPASARNA